MHPQSWPANPVAGPDHSRWPVAARQPGTATATPVPPVMMRVSNVSKRFGRREVLREVNMQVRAGEVAAVVGANGAGKSTFLKICAGLISPTDGQVEVYGSIGYCPQVGGTFDFLRAKEHFTLFGRGAGLDRGNAVRRGTEIAGMLDWQPDMKTEARHLSGGTRQKLNVVLSILGGHDVLLLDEPYQGFDKGSYTDFWDVIWRLRASGRAVLVVTHMLNELDRVDQVLDLTPQRRAAR